MNLSNTHLRLCEELSQAGFLPRFDEGRFIGRGFADLGYEAFLILPGQKLLSLFTAQVTTLPEEHKHFFFQIPQVSDILAKLRENAWGFSSELEEASGELLVRISKNGAIFEEKGKDFEVLLFKIFKNSLAPE